MQRGGEEGRKEGVGEGGGGTCKGDLGDGDARLFANARAEIAKRRTKGILTG
jgi:hypothetical protein